MHASQETLDAFSHSPSRHKQHPVEPRPNRAPRRDTASGGLAYAEHAEALRRKTDPVRRGAPAVAEAPEERRKRIVEEQVRVRADGRYYEGDISQRVRVGAGRGHEAGHSEFVDSRGLAAVLAQEKQEKRGSKGQMSKGHNENARFHNGDHCQRVAIPEPTGMTHDDEAALTYKRLLAGNRHEAYAPGAAELPPGGGSHTVTRKADV